MGCAARPVATRPWKGPWRRAWGRCLLACVLLAGAARAGEPLHNWFDDPFFAISSAIPDCPLPRGPYATAAERAAQAHRRAEKGTTCWLAGEAGCERPSAYAYDRDIAAAVQAALQREHPFARDTSVWVTGQGRVVYLEGCARRPQAAAELEDWARAIPHVQQATALLRTDPRAPPPYRTR